jgi:hypothetical protein
LPSDLDKALTEAIANLDEIFCRYDEAAAELIRIARLDGHFAGRHESDLAWPPSRSDTGAPLDTEGLERRAELIAEIHDGIPPRRNRRLVDAHDHYAAMRPAYLRALRLFLQVQRQFTVQEAGDSRDFSDLYSVVYLEALARENPVPLDDGEAALVEFKVARTPLAHAASIVDKIRPGAGPEDPRWCVEYQWDLDGEQGRGSLRELLTKVAESVVDFLAAGEHLAIRYNTFSNFIWFGISVWKAVTEVELLISRLRTGARARAAWVDKLEQFVRLAQALLLKFLGAHLEDPAQIRPTDYWYGQQYSYLTRDMIDLTRELVRNGERLRARYGPDLPIVELPPLLRGASHGAFHEYRHVGRAGSVTPWVRRARLFKWVRTFRSTAKQKKRIHRAQMSDAERRAAAWQVNLEWAEATLRTFDIDLTVTIDPAFADVARELDLRPGAGRKVVFFPTHQSLLDHPIMYRTLQSPELLQAMGWSASTPCCLLSRARLMQATAIRVAGREISLIGLSPGEIDRLQEEVDGYVILGQDDTGSPIKRFAQILNERPGVVYGGGTTSSFDLQVLPMQHALFAHLPQDTVFIPVAFRGIHSLWPKSPRGNLDVSPGRVDVYVSPPVPGETTLLPRKRALRTQLEPATLFQAMHIATLLDPATPSLSQDPRSS